MNSAYLSFKKCPKCGFVFTTKSIKTVRCKRCLHTFKVYYKERIGSREFALKSRVVGIVKGTRAELFKKLEELRYGK